MNTGSDRLMRGIVLSLGFLLLTLFLLHNISKNPLSGTNTQVDEQAHLSYALTLIHKQRWWPDFDHFTMYDPITEKALSATNYNNHSPAFYWFAKIARAINPSLTTSDFRHGATALTLLSLALYSCIGYRMNLGLAGSSAYAFFPLLIYFHLQTGFYNNDAFAILGGMLVVYASYDWFSSGYHTRIFWLTMLGLSLASVKLTAFLLVGLYFSACLLLSWRSARTLPRLTCVAATLWLTVLSLPYAYFVQQWGSPAPETLGQVKLMTAHSGENWSRVLIDGWVQQPRMDMLHWCIAFLRDFAVQISAYDTTFIALALLGVCLLRAALKPQQPTHPAHARMLQACLIATLIALSIHAVFSYERYVHYGWRLDSGLRYYFPLLAAYGAACAHAVMPQHNIRNKNAVEMEAK